MWQYNYAPDIYHHGIKGQKWGIRRTPAQLGRKGSAKHRDSVSRRQYSNARFDYRKQKLTERYDRTLSKEKRRYDRSRKTDSDKDRLKAARQLHEQNMRDVDTRARNSAIIRDVTRTAVSSIAKSSLVPTGAAAVTALSLALGGVPTLAMAMPTIAGAAWLGGLGANVSNAYRGYQTARNVVDIYNSRRGSRK